MDFLNTSNTSDPDVLAVFPSPRVTHCRERGLYFDKEIAFWRQDVDTVSYAHENVAVIGNAKPVGKPLLNMSVRYNQISNGSATSLVRQVPRPCVSQCGATMNHVESPDNVRISDVVWVIDYLTHGWGVIWDSLGSRVGYVESFEIGGKSDTIRLLQMVVDNPNRSGFGIESPHSRRENGMMGANPVPK
jgi:hypothetical protein